MTATPLSTLELAAASTLIVASGVFSMLLGLGIGMRIVVAALRMVAQLMFAALIVTSLFADTSIGTSLAVLMFICAVTVGEVASKVSHPLRPIAVHLATASTVLSGALIAALLMIVLVQPTPWYAPRVVVPVLGMLLGHAASGCAIALDLLTAGVVRERGSIETRMALGASRHEAFGPILSGALKAAIMPTVMLLTTAGLVVLPGFMSGQIMAGVEANEAAKYQILLMLIIAGGGIIGVLATAFGALAVLTDKRGRLRREPAWGDGANENAAGWWPTAQTRIAGRIQALVLHARRLTGSGRR